MSITAPHLRHSRLGPYARHMAESDERVALALARLDTIPDEALPARRSRAIIEHKRTGERRVYGQSPIGREIMS